MNTGIRMGRKTSLLVTLLGLVAAVAWMLACAASHRSIEAPVPTDNYTFTKYQIPETKPPASVPVTVAVVNTDVDEVERLGLRKFVESFSDFLGSSLDEIIVAKGMTAKGPYDSLDMITYPDKKGSDLTLTEKLFISPGRSEQISTERVSINSGSGRNVLCDMITFEATFKVWITLEMREPLSGEKMWVKKIDLGTHTEEYQKAFAFTYRDGGKTMVRRSKPLFDTREDTIARLFDTLYPKIMETAWNYLNTDEMLMLKKTGKEIRKVKRY